MAKAVEYLLGLFGIILRIGLMQTNLPKWLQSRNEVVSPLTSWERVEEGFALQDKFISPYSGDLFHETPLALRGLKITNYCPWGVNGFFLLIDFITLVFLCRVAAKFGEHLLADQHSKKETYSPQAASILLNSKQLLWLPSIVLAVHALNPFSITTTLALSTGAITNLAILLAFYYLLADNRPLCTLFISLATYQAFYPIVFLVPAGLHFYKNKCSQSSTKSFVSRKAVINYLETCSLCLLFLSLLIGCSYLVEGSWEFLQSTYGFILSVPDLTPNTGVFWYFFTEMFDHFRTFFVCVFQLNAVVYTVPLAVKFAEKPVFLMYILLVLTAIFKSYPSYVDAALYFSLLPLWKHTFSYLRNTLVVAGMFVTCMVLAPILYHLWIFAGSANANFYFAITLTYSTAQIFLVTDLLFAYLRREYDLYHGTEHTNADGSKAQIVLE